MQVHPTIAIIQNALAYATFPHKQMRTQLDEYLKALGSDFTDADYQPGEDVEAAMEELNDTMSEIDNSLEHTSDAISNVDADDNEDDIPV